MLPIKTIYSEFDKHLRVVADKVLEASAKNLPKTIADKHGGKGYIPKAAESPLVSTQMLFDIIEQEYINRFSTVIETVMEVFNKNHIGFRLYDISYTVNGHNMFVLFWVINNKEFVMELRINYGEERSSAAQFTCVNSCGDVSKGDILENVIRTIDDTFTIPSWFIKELQSH